MAEANPLSLFWEGFEPERHELDVSGPYGCACARRLKCASARCGGGLQPYALIHETDERRIRERDLIDPVADRTGTSRALWLLWYSYRAYAMAGGVPRSITAALARDVEALTRLWPIR